MAIDSRAVTRQVVLQARETALASTAHNWPKWLDCRSGEPIAENVMFETEKLSNGPRGLPLLGSLLEMAKDPLAFHVRLVRDYQPLASFRLGPANYYAVTDPDVIEELLVGKHRDCVKDRVTRELYPLVGKGLLTSDGDPWRRQRKLSAPPFSPKNISAYADTMVDCARRAFAEYQDGQVRDFHVDIMAVTLEIVGKTLLGFDTNSDAERVARAMDDAIPYFEQRLFTIRGLLPKSLPLPTHVRFRRAKRDLDAVVNQIITRAREAGPESNHLLARLMHAHDETGQGMSQAQLADEALTMLLAGHETTALAIMFTVYALADHPAVADQLRAEVDKRLQGRPITRDDLTELPLLDAVLRETLRLYPTVPMFAREVASPIELGGFVVPRHAQVITSPYAIQRSPQFYTAPNAFRPERWLDGSTVSTPKFAYFPFGGGPRVCIGQHFALMEAKLVLATLIQQVVLSVPDDFIMDLSPVITLRSRNGLRVNVARRNVRTLESHAITNRRA